MKEYCPRDVGLQYLGAEQVQGVRCNLRYTKECMSVQRKALRGMVYVFQLWAVHSLISEGDKLSMRRRNASIH